MPRRSNNNSNKNKNNENENDEKVLMNKSVRKDDEDEMVAKTVDGSAQFIEM